MPERPTSTLTPEPKLREYAGVFKLTWVLDGQEIEICMGVALNKRELSDQLAVMSKLNGAHPHKVAEIEDAYCPISASEMIEVYDSPQESDSPTSQMQYLARERNRPRRVFIQSAAFGSLASIHAHEEGDGIWERYDWIRGKLGILLPNEQRGVVDENSRRLDIPGGLRHQATGESRQRSITIITTTAKQHIHSDIL